MWLCVQSLRYHTQWENYKDSTRPEHMHHANHLLHYLKGHLEMISFNLQRFSYIDGKDDVIIKISTTRKYPKLQPTATTLTLESEYMVLYGGIQEPVWLRGVMKAL
jgi:hypothetical protein